MLELARRDDVETKWFDAAAYGELISPNEPLVVREPGHLIVTSCDINPVATV